MNDTLLADMKGWIEAITDHLRDVCVDEDNDGYVSTWFNREAVYSALCEVQIKTLRQAASMTRADCYVLADKIEKGETQ